MEKWLVLPLENRYITTKFTSGLIETFKRIETQAEYADVAFACWPLGDDDTDWFLVDELPDIIEALKTSEGKAAAYITHPPRVEEAPKYGPPLLEYMPVYGPYTDWLISLEQHESELYISLPLLVKWLEKWQWGRD